MIKIKAKYRLLKSDDYNKWYALVVRGNDVLLFSIIIFNLHAVNFILDFLS